MANIPTPMNREESDDESGQSPGLDSSQDEQPVYDPRSFDSLNVSPEIRQLFSYITLYNSRLLDLDFKLKPFIPDFIPSVGDIDAFIKVPRPDGVDDGLGLQVLDEPSISKQSDASLLSLRLKALAKDTPMNIDQEKVRVKTVSTAADIDNWIENLRKLHQETNSSQNQSLAQSSRLPEIDVLMQEWDADFEEVLKTVTLPPPDIDCDLGEYVTIICSLLDIPVHGSKIASLHQLFSLYNEFRSSQHFRQIN